MTFALSAMHLNAAESICFLDWWNGFAYIWNIDNFASLDKVKMKKEKTSQRKFGSQEIVNRFYIVFFIWTISCFCNVSEMAKIIFLHLYCNLFATNWALSTRIYFILKKETFIIILYKIDPEDLDSILYASSPEFSNHPLSNQ